MKSLKHCENYQNVIQKHSKQTLLEKQCQQTCSKRVTTELQFVKTAVSVKHSKVKHNKSRYACIKTLQKQFQQSSLKRGIVNGSQNQIYNS